MTALIPGDTGCAACPHPVDEHSAAGRCMTHAGNTASPCPCPGYQRPVRHPETVNLSKAADYLLTVAADLKDAKGIPHRLEGAYYAALDLWEDLTGLTGDAALDYARAIRSTGTTAHLSPF